MTNARRNCGLFLILTALFAVGGGHRAHATYTKLYRFYNQTGAAQGYVRATTVGLEIVPTATQYASPTAWAPGTTGQLVVTGVPSTTLTFGIRSGVSSGVTVANGAMAQTGWRTTITPADCETFAG